MSDARLLDARVAQVFYGRFNALRPAQEAAIQPLLNGKNVILASGTGSGKTEAILAPLVSLHWRAAVERDELALLYIAPTRALLNDILRRIEGPLAELGVRTGIRHGDRNDLGGGRVPHVLLTTPESLDVLLFNKTSCVGTVKAVILDEVHLLYNTQRGLHLAVLMQRLRMRLGRSVQWAALSATIADPGDIRTFVFGEKEPAEFLVFPGARDIEAHVRRISREDEFLSVVKRIQEGGPSKLLVFADSRKVCERLAGILRRDATVGRTVFAHYSSLSPEVRRETESRFGAERQAVCVATSTLELGIDIGDIDAVVLWGVPSSVESFLQRIGRSNRRSHKTNVVCLVPDDSVTPLADTLRFIAVLRMAQAGEVPARRPYELYGAVAQQCLNVIASDNGRFTRIADLAAMFQFKGYVDRSRVEAILGELEAKERLQRHGFKNQYGANEGLHELVDFMMIFGNFGVGSQTVEVRHGSKVLGTVPAVNLLRLHAGVNVRFAGRQWHLRRCSPDGFLVEPARGHGESADFMYPGGGRGCAPAVVAKMWDVLFGDEAWASILARSDREALTGFRKAFVEQCGGDTVPCVRTSDAFHYLTFGSRWVNKAIGLHTKQSFFEAGDLCLKTRSPVDWGSLPSAPADYEAVFPSLFEGNAEQSVYQQMLPQDLQLIEFIQAWLKDPAVGAILARLKGCRTVPIAPGLVHALCG